MEGQGLKRHMAGAILLLAAWSVWTAVRYWDSYAIDLAAIYIAGHFASVGDMAMLYGGESARFAVGNAPEWRGVLESHGITGQSGSHYVYPPLWAFAVAPFADATDPIAFFNAGRILLILSLAGSVLAVWRLMKVPLSPFLFALIAIIFIETTIPAAAALSLGQPQLLVIFLILLAFERYASGREVTAGALLGLAAAIKVTPILLALIFVADKRWRAVGAAAGIAAGLALLSVAIAGFEAHLVFLSGVSWMESLMPVVGLNLTFETVMHDFFVPFVPCDPCSDPRMGADTAWVTLAGKLLLAASLVAGLWATSTLSEADRLRVRLMLISTAALFFGPLAWMHYYTLTMLLFLGFALRLGWRLAVISAIPVWIGFSQAWMGSLLRNATAFPFETMYPQHTALLSLLFIVTVTVFAAFLSSGKLRNKTYRTVNPAR